MDPETRNLRRYIISLAVIVVLLAVADACLLSTDKCHYVPLVHGVAFTVSWLCDLVFWAWRHKRRFYCYTFMLLVTVVGGLVIIWGDPLFRDSKLHCLISAHKITYTYNGVQLLVPLFADIAVLTWKKCRNNNEQDNFHEIE